MPPPRSSMAWIWWLVGGCAVVLVIAVVAAGFGAYTLINRFQSGGFSCLPPDFPIFPHASVVAENTQIGNEFTPGDSTRCNMAFQSNDSAATVTAYYDLQLMAGDWTIVSSDPANGFISFQRKSSSRTAGTVTVLGLGQHTSIEVQLDS
jgi:hypothetical protein